MKIILIKILIFYSLIQAFGQNNKDIFIDFNPKINNNEAEYLNIKFFQQKGNFDFKDTKVGFVFIEGNYIINKNDFYSLFEQESDKIFELKILTDSIKEIAGGFDVLILISNKDKKIHKINDDKLNNAFSEQNKSVPENLYLLGLDTDSILTDLEANFFNNKFKDKRKDFDFRKCKIGFFAGNYGSQLSSKKKYFDKYKDRISHNYLGSSDDLLILTEEQKVELKGYDAIIVSWSKILVSKPTDTMIKKIKN
jgi:hypothetical protein